MMKKTDQRGVALLFALGMLALLLVSGMAFVANSLTARKIAANNSYRSQARIFAQSALSRVLASIMMYQHQVFKASANPESFGKIQSFGKLKVNDGDDISDETSLNDGLQTDASGNSLLTLPLDNTVVAENIAKDFNEKLASWNGKWVYFYNNWNKNSDDRIIIGRAAWQVVSYSPQISAPVFLSGHLLTDLTDEWTPAKHRWGREINEVFTTTSELFKNIQDPNDGITDDSSSFQLQEYEQIFAKLGCSGNDDASKKIQRWIESWFVADPSDNFLDNPTEIIPEIYTYTKGNNAIEQQLMRFNISELSSDSIPADLSGGNLTEAEIKKVRKKILGEYGVNDANYLKADPWYARFGIDSVANAATCNSEEFLNKNFTVDSPTSAAGDQFDFKLNKEDRPSLPFLRRIGDAEADLPTFKNDDGTYNVAAWRKQIAANFNDYCDADSTPTSNVPATDWNNVNSEMPSFTGNELTPYIYELGYSLGIISSNDKDDAKAGFAAFTDESSYANKKVTLPTAMAGYLNLKLHAKLANIYPFANDDAAKQFKVESFPESVKIKFKPTAIKAEITYSYDKMSEKKEYNITVDDADKFAKFAYLNSSFTASHTFDYSGIDEETSTGAAIFDKVNNSDGLNPYPVSKLDKTDASKFGRIRDLTFTREGEEVSNELSLADIRSISNNEINIPNEATNVDVKVKIEIKKINIEAIDIRVKRTVLNYTQDGVVSNVDFVSSFTGDNGAIKWTKPADATGMELDFSDLEKQQPVLLIGGIRNYDPRQNLNPGDWKYDELKLHVKNSPELYPTYKDDLSSVMDIVPSGDDKANGKANGTDNNPMLAEFNPNTSDNNHDKELVDDGNGPGWADTGDGRDNSKRLSTAFIRNAPMMSPWEIGLIHRGVKWQTINIKNSCDPSNNTKNISPAGHAPHGDKWDLSGTRYGGASGYFGDGAILDQIKMTDRCSTYGKINVNRLREDCELFDEENDYQIAKVLFENIYTQESILQFYKNSTRYTGDPKIDLDFGSFLSSDETGSTITNFSTSHFDKLNASRKPHKSRAEFIGWANVDMKNAFGAASIAYTDAGSEEVIGKTVNLLCAENSSPSQIRVVVVAQAIRDIGGTQYRKANDGTDKEQDCEFGVFDYDSSNNIYYDEITGEVKMLVTVDRDIDTGRLFVSRIDYLE